MHLRRSAVLLWFIKKVFGRVNRAEQLQPAQSSYSSNELVNARYRFIERLNAQIVASFQVTSSGKNRFKDSC